MEINQCIEEINNELQLLDELLQSHELLIKKVEINKPDQIEISAAATLLHSFYNGLENIFKRIANRIDEKMPSSNYWHQELLQQMTFNTEKRKAVISEDLSEKLNLYLGFRHFFRHAYAFQFNWGKMKDLILDIINVKNQFKKEIEEFTSSLKPK